MFKHYVKRTIRKIIAIPLFIIFTFVSLVIKPFSALLRLASLPCSALAVIVAAINFFNSGVLYVTLQFFAVAGLFIAIYLVAPYFPAYVYNTRYNLKKIVSHPIVIRPPVRFTM